jgi:hypothetical protein
MRDDRDGKSEKAEFLWPYLPFTAKGISKLLDDNESS